jgi:RNA polymerase sigma factor (sigma-70 family)
MDERRRRFEIQVIPHLDAAYRFARWLTRSPDDAQDVVQEAFLRAFRGFDALRGTDVKSWLLTIVRNCHYTALKQQQRRAALPLPDEKDGDDPLALTSRQSDPEATTIHYDNQCELDRLVSALPDHYREVLILREVEDLDYREIASVTNVPIGTVMSRLARARAALKKNWLSQVNGGPRASS